MKTIAIGDKAEKALLRSRLKAGLAWSYLNPDLLSPGELLPIIQAADPPDSPAALVPFPVAEGRFSLDPVSLAREKINWCGRGLRGPAQLKRVAARLAYYDLQPSREERYSWFRLDPGASPYLPLFRLILPAFAIYTVPNPQPPSPLSPKAGESWVTVAPDAFGLSANFSATYLEDAVLLAFALTRSGILSLYNFKLPSHRYIFLRQQLFFLLPNRLQPWSVPEDRANPLRGKIYKKP